MNELRDATLQAERALIGSILVYSAGSCPDAINYCKHVVKPSDFLFWHSESTEMNINFRIYTAMLLCDAPQQINTAQKMADLNLLMPMDISYMSRCIAELQDDDYEAYAQVVAGYSFDRKIKRLKEQGKVDEVARLMASLNKPKDIVIGVNL